jgi:hypothetical protein
MNRKLLIVGIVLFCVLFTADVTIARGQAPVSEPMAATAMKTLWRDASKNESGSLR